MAHTIIWIDGWVGGSRPPWPGAVEKIVSHNPATKGALKDRAEALGSRARMRLQTTPRSRREAQFESEGVLSIEVRHAPAPRHGKATLLDSSVHLKADASGRGIDGRWLATAIEFGHTFQGVRHAESGARLPQRVEGLGILRGSARSMGQKTWRFG